MTIPTFIQTLNAVNENTTTTNNATNQHKSYKIVLVGDGGVGKTTLVKRHLTNTFETKYIPTVGVEVTPLVFYTNQGSITFNIWDTAGQEKFGGLRDGYYIEMDAAIVFFDRTSRLSFRNVPTWIKELRSVKDVPILLVGTKSDLKATSIGMNTIRMMCNDHDVEYHELSTKTNNNIQAPFLSLARRLQGNEELCFSDPIEAPKQNHLLNHNREDDEEDDDAHVDDRIEPYQLLAQEPRSERIDALLQFDGFLDEYQTFIEGNEGKQLISGLKELIAQQVNTLVV